MAESMCENFSCVCSKLLDRNERKGLDKLAPPNTHGMYCILELINRRYKAIYVGTGNIRARLQSHLNGNDKQCIGKYLQEKDNRSIKISWVEVDKRYYTEHDVIECVAKTQGQWPKCNKKKGNKS